ncbi:oxidoreductase [Rhizobiaceae sp. 2RAB30]
MKTWFITGASRGLGLAIARAALANGDNVVGTAKRPASLEEAMGTSEQLLALPLDVTKRAEVTAAVAAARSRFGDIDVLVNNAGYGQFGWFEDHTDDQIRAQFETNVFAAMDVTRAVLPRMRARRTGHVFTISSITGLVSGAGGTVYSASKFAVEGWMEGLAEELRPLGIAATVVEPGFFRTEFLGASSAAYTMGGIADYAEQFDAFKGFLDQMNGNQNGDPAKLAAAIVQLAGMATPPIRWAAGTDAVDWVIQKADALRENAERYRQLSTSMDAMT